LIERDDYSGSRGTGFQLAIHEDFIRFWQPKLSFLDYEDVSFYQQQW
jgi:hypothetical protein